MLSVALNVLLVLMAILFPIHYLVTRRLEQEREGRLGARRAKEAEFVQHVREIVSTQKAERL